MRKETGSRGPKLKQGQGLSEHQEMTSTARSCGAGFSGGLCLMLEANPTSPTATTGPRPDHRSHERGLCALTSQFPLLLLYRDTLESEVKTKQRKQKKHHSTLLSTWRPSEENEQLEKRTALGASLQAEASERQPLQPCSPGPWEFPVRKGPRGQEPGASQGWPQGPAPYLESWTVCSSQKLGQTSSLLLASCETESNT